MRKTHIVKIFLITAVAATAFGIAAFRQSIGSRTIAVGSFHSVSHKGRGIAEIVVKSDGRMYLRLTDFSTYHRPDLTVLLISASDALENETVKRSEIYEVGRLKTDEGSMEYPLAADLDVGRFNAVTIWSKRYEVNFTTAPLRFR